MELQLSSILKESLFYFSILVLVVGFLLLLLPSMFIAKSGKFNAWIDTDKYFDFVNRTHVTERKFYKYSKYIAACMLVLCLYILYTLTMVITDEDVSRLIGFSFFSAMINEWLAEALRYILICFNVVALFLSIVLLIRPSAIKGLEELANTWFKSDSTLHALDQSYDVAEKTMTPLKLRIIGMLVIITCLYILVFMY